MTKMTDKLIDKMAALLVIAAFCLLGVGCVKSDNVAYSKFLAVSEDGWSRMDCANFLVADGDTIIQLADSTLYDVIMVVRYTNEYPYQQLYLSVEEMYHVGEFVTDTVAFDIAYPDGRLLGGVQGGLHESVDTLRRAVRLSRDYSLTVSHCMSEELLQGVSDVGILIKESKE